MSISTLLVDDHDIVRQGLKGVLQNIPSIEVVGEAKNGLEACQLANQLSPQLVIMDMAMPLMNGTEATRKIKKTYSDTKIIVLSMYDRREFVLDMLAAGISGYLLKHNAVNELPQAIEAAMSGHVYLSPKIAGLITKEYVELGGAQQAPNLDLTSRERQVLQLLAEGQSSKQIAKLLELGETTVVTHRQSIMNKTRLRSIAELTKYAVQQGITSLDTLQGPSPHR